jgi:NADH:ubiquinone oxidoreductase subunit 2 (subunit N)
MFISYTLADILFCQSLEVLLSVHLLSLTCLSVFLAGNRYIAYPRILLPSLSITSFLVLVFLPVPLSLLSLSHTSYFLGIIGLELPGLVVKTFMLGTLFLVLISNRSFLSTMKHFGYEYSILLVISLIALSILCSTNDFLTIYLTIELQSLVFYSLIAMQSRSEYSIEAAIKYFVLGAIASCFLLFGLFLIYSQYGTIQLNELSLLLVNGAMENIGSTFGLVLLISAFLFKIGIAPFHV